MAKRPFSTALNCYGIDLKANLSKQEEISIMDTLYLAFHDTGNYLEHFFTREMVSHVSQKIHDDIIPDVYYALQCETETSDRLKKERDEAIRERDAHRANTSLLLDALGNKHQEQIQVLHDKIVKLEKRRENLYEENSNLRMLVTLRDEEAKELRASLAASETRIAACHRLIDQFAKELGEEKGKNK